MTQIAKEHSLELDIIRHAQKGPDGMLLPEGIANAIIYGQTLLPNNGRTKVYTSDIQRAVDTGSLISDAANALYARRTRSYLSEYPYTDEKISELGLSGGKWMYLNEGNKHLPSVRIVAGKLAKFILAEQRFLSRIEDPDKLHIIAVTHGPTITCFLMQVLAFQMGKEVIDTEVEGRLKDIAGNWLFPVLTGFKVTIPKEGNIQLMLGNIAIPLQQDFLQTLQVEHDNWEENK